MKRGQRDVGPELLRIIAIFLIILHHFSVYGDFGHFEVTVNEAVKEVFCTCGKVGVDIFVLITGYYSITSTAKLRKAIKLIFETIFYSVSAYLISCACGVSELNAGYIIKSFLPFISNKGYWFITTYILLYCCIPVINRGIKELSQRQYLCFLGLLFFVWSLVSFATFWEVPTYSFSNLGWFIFVYLLGGYLKLYPIKLYQKKH